MARKQKEELLSLEKQFEDPLNGINNRINEFDEDINEILSRLEKNLEVSNDDWSIRYNSLLQIMEYLKGGVFQSQDCDFSRLAEGIASCVTDLRSALVKRGSLLISASSVILGKDYLSSLDIITPALFKQLSHGTSVISNSVRYALLSIVKNVQSRRTARLILSKATSKSSIHKQVIAESIKIMREEWPSQIIDGMENELNTTLKTLSEDASGEVRQIAKQALSIQRTPTKVISRSPRMATPTEKKANNRRGSQTPQLQQRSKVPVFSQKAEISETMFGINENIEDQNKCETILKKNNNQNKAPNTSKKVLFGPPKEKFTADNSMEISEFMPPRTQSEARSFLKILGDIIKSKSFDKLDGLEELLGPSIISATHVIQKSDLYIKIIPPLLEQYNQEFSVQIHDILIALHFDPILLAESVNAYDEQEIAETFVNKRESEELESLKFFITFFTHKYDLNITPKIRQFLLKIVQKYRSSYDVSSIEEAIKVPETDSNLCKIVDSLIHKIESLKNWVPIYQQLVVQLSSSTIDSDCLDIIEERLISQLKQLLENGSPEQCHEVRSFLMNGAINCMPISFSQLIEPMITMMMNDNRVEKEKTEECYLVLMNDPKSISILIDILEHDDNEEKIQTILSIILKYLSNHSLRQISTLLPMVAEILSTLIKSEIVGVRRLSIMILVEFKCKVPNEFMPYYRKLSISHQKLINLYSNKRG